MMTVCVKTLSSVDSSSGEFSNRRKRFFSNRFSVQKTSFARPVDLFFVFTTPFLL